MDKSRDSLSLKVNNELAEKIMLPIYLTQKNNYVKLK